MINEDSWWHSYLIVRGEILGFVTDDFLRTHVPRVFPWIKNEKMKEFEDDQIPSKSELSDLHTNGWVSLTASLLQHSMKNPSFGVLVGVCSQSGSLKELMEGHCWDWSVRLDFTQHKKTHQVQK